MKMTFHLKEVAMHAASAASAAFKSVMAAVPFPVNLVAAPVAAGAVFAATMAIGAVTAERGADLPNMNTIGMLHPREMVLPEKYADVIRGMAAGGGSQGGGRGGQTFTGDIHAHYHASPGETLNESKVISILKSAMRNGNLQLA